MNRESIACDAQAVPQELESLLARLRAAKDSPTELATLLDAWTRRRDDDPVWH